MHKDSIVVQVSSLATCRHEPTSKFFPLFQEFCGFLLFGLQLHLRKSTSCRQDDRDLLGKRGGSGIISNS